MARKRLTKKMFEILAPLEMRKIALNGLNVSVKHTYTDTLSELAGRIKDASEVFATLDMDALNTPIKEGGKDTFRPAILVYLKQIQAAILDKSVDYPDIPTGEIEEAEPTMSMAAIPAPEPEAEEPAAEVEEPKKHKKGKKNVLKKRNVGKRAVPAVGAPAKCDMTELREETQAKLEELSKDLKDYIEPISVDVLELASSLRDVSNALVYILNCLVLDDGEEVTDLLSIPDPSEYL